MKYSKSVLVSVITIMMFSLFNVGQVSAQGNSIDGISLADGPDPDCTWQRINITFTIDSDTNRYLSISNLVDYYLNDFHSIGTDTTSLFYPYNSNLQAGYAVTITINLGTTSMGSDLDSQVFTFICDTGAAAIDTDRDHIVDGSDNCPTNANTNQADIDSDGTGDSCDSQDNRDSDSDGVQNWEDICPGFDDNVDTDGDNTPDGCDTTPNGDDDNDGVDNNSDICPGFDDNVDTDGDNIPDGCDSTPNGDDDNDGVDNNADICPGFDDNVDTDSDNIPDGCDTTPNGDDDGDGIDNATDNCPNTANATQTDFDGDGIGDACDPLNNRDLDGDGVDIRIDFCPERGDEGFGVYENGCPPHVVLPPDKRINWQYGDLNSVIYTHADGVAVYCYNQGSTWLGLHINQALVDNANANQAQDIPVAEYNENGCQIAFYILDSGEYQLNIWTWDGKLYEIIADNINFANATMRWFE